MDYKKTAAEILPLIGGKENILSLVHCATRLRFSLADGEAFQAEELKKVKGVMGAMFTGGQYQVIIGTDVNHVYDNLLHMTGLEGGCGNRGAVRLKEWRERKRQRENGKGHGHHFQPVYTGDCGDHRSRHD